MEKSKVDTLTSEILSLNSHGTWGDLFLVPFFFIFLFLTATIQRKTNLKERSGLCCSGYWVWRARLRDVGVLAYRICRGRLMLPSQPPRKGTMNYILKRLRLLMWPCHLCSWHERPLSSTLMAAPNKNYSTRRVIEIFIIDKYHG